jgi:hypothetical protein
MELVGCVGDEVRPMPASPADASIVNIDGHFSLIFIILTTAQTQFITLQR